MTKISGLVAEVSGLEARISGLMIALKTGSTNDACCTYTWALSLQQITSPTCVFPFDVLGCLNVLSWILKDFLKNYDCFFKIVM